MDKVTTVGIDLAKHGDERRRRRRILFRLAGKLRSTFGKNDPRQHA